MVKLLMRFYDVNSGQILLDNHDVRDYNRRDLRKVFGIVLQDTWLYKGTVMENIRYGRLDCSQNSHERISLLLLRTPELTQQMPGLPREVV